MKGQKKVEFVMREWKAGRLHSGSGAIIRNRKQAVAIALKMAGLSRKGRK